jgi:polysaccharide biosynthesis/export protein
MIRTIVKVQTVRLYPLQQHINPSRQGKISRSLIKIFSPTASFLMTAFAVTAYLPASLAQVPAPDSTVPETPIDIPIESTPQPNTLTGPPGEGAIQVPEIVPIPPQAVPTGPLAPLPGAVADPARDENVYVLGPGDRIVVNIFDVPEFSAENGTYTVLVDGSITFPWIGRISMQGLTLEEASALLEREYGGRGFIVEPLISVNLATARALKVSVVGEVKRPGPYDISPTGDTAEPLLTATAGGVAVDQWPSVTDAIQAAGGISQLADLRNVQIRRAGRNGAEELIDVNLWELLRSGRLNQDVTLRDGDTIVIPTAVALSSDEAILLGAANFAPETITINVVGEVITPGPLEVAPNTSLNQAIQASGGFDRQRARTRRVDLVRLNSNGTAVRRRIRLDLAAGINEETNPALQPGDTIIVGRSDITSLGDTVTSVVDPIDGILGIFDLFGDLFD